MAFRRRRVVAWWSALRGRCRGGTGGRSSLVDCGVRLIFEGFTSRPGIRRGSPSSSGLGRRGPDTHSHFASLARRSWAFLGARARPGNVPGAVVGVGSVKRGGLPEECGEFACAGDRDDAGGLAALRAQVLPALVEALLGAPGDRDHARVLALLAAGESFADRGTVAVMVGGLDQEAAGVGGSGLGDRALAAPFVGGALGGHDAEEARQQARLWEPSEVADLGGEARGRQRVDAPEAA